MNKDEKAIADSIAQILLEAMEKLSAAVELNAAATRYLADTIGYKADSLNPVDEKGHQLVKLELVTDAPEEMKEPKTTLEDVKAALNNYARGKGKNKTMALVNQYVPSGDIKKLKEEDYDKILKRMI